MCCVADFLDIIKGRFLLHIRYFVWMVLIINMFIGFFKNYQTDTVNQGG